MALSQGHEKVRGDSQHTVDEKELPSVLTGIVVGIFEGCEVQLLTL